MDQLRERSVPSSELTVGGLLKHLALVEDVYFSWKMAGQPPVTWMAVPEDDVERWQFAVDPEETAEQLYALWEAAVARPRESLAALIAEYGRHTGHMDLLREAIDGRVGEDPPEGWPMLPTP